MINTSQSLGLGRAFVVAALLAGAPAQAANTTFTGATNGAWATGANWSLGTAPTSSDDVFSNNATNARITATTAAVASSVTIGGAAGTSTVQLHSTGTNSLTVGGNITLAPGAGAGTLTLEGASTLTLNSGAGHIFNGGGAGLASLVVQGGFSGSLGLASATVDDLNMAQTGNGTLTINSGQTYNVGNLLRLNNNGIAGTAGVININGGTLNVGDTVGSGAGELRLNSGAGTVNTAYVNINSGGILKAETITRRFLASDAAINWNDGTIANYAGSNMTLSASAGEGTLNIKLAGTGAHTFDAESGRTITVQSTAVLADQAGQNGTLAKAGLGTLTFEGANTYSGATVIQSGTLKLNASGAFANSSTITVGGSGSSNAVLDLTAKTGTFSFGSSQIVRGIGTIRMDAVDTAEFAGILAPGNSPGVLTFDGGTALLSGTLQIELIGATRGTGYDAIDLVNSAALNYGTGVLALDFGSWLADPQSYQLFGDGSSTLSAGLSSVTIAGGNYTGLTFSGSNGVWTSQGTSPSGQTVTFTEATGTLVIVPEPGALALAAAGVGLAAAWARRRRPCSG